MTVPANTFRSFSAVGNREDLKDVIYNIAPLETPFTSSVGKEDANNTLFEWQTDSLASPAENKALEGDDAAAGASTPTARLNNRTQISTKTARVSGTNEAIKKAGRSSELAYQELKRGKELKRDIELIALSNKPMVAAADGTEGETAGIGAWIKTNTSKAGDGSDPTTVGTDARNDGTQRAFTEVQLKDVLLKCFESGGAPDTLMMKGFNRQVFSSFLGRGTTVQKAEDKVLHASFDIYQGDFGQLKAVPNRFQRARDVLVLQMDMWKLAFLPGRNMKRTPLAKTGDSDAVQILSEWGLQANQEAASGGVFDLTTA